MTRALRFLLGALGVGIGIYGASLLRDIGTDNLFETGKWLVGGVILHDAILGPATILLATILTLGSRRRVPAPVIIGGIVLASVTLAALPVLGRYGARPDNATLLPRDYVGGWFAFAGLVLLSVVVTLVVSHRRTPREQ